MKLTDEQNYAFVNDARRVAAEKKMREIVQHIQASVSAESPTAEYYLTVLPPLLNQLNDAAENLIIVEAEVEAEILGANHWHG